MDYAKFMAGIRSGDANARFEAWRAAGEMPAAVIPELGKLAASPDPGVAKAAREALTTLTHSVGKDPASAKRPAVVKEILALTAAAHPLAVRVHALRLLSNIADQDSAPAIAAHLKDAELREEAVYCLERIPGDAPVQAILTAYKEAGNGFKPRLLAALGHRRAAEAVPVCLEAMRSADPDLAMAAMKAFGRIGVKPSQPAVYPPETSLSEWQKMERMDSLLRYADAQALGGNHADAIAAYKAALERPEEHWQCAAIVGLGRIATAEAASAIYPKMKSSSRIVRITARNVWQRIGAG
jgi:HEAT repeat protein